MWYAGRASTRVSHLWLTNRHVALLCPMTRLSSAELASYTNSLRQREGALPAEAEGGQITTHPPGTPVPTQPGRTPTRSVPRSRNPAALIEAAVDAVCQLYNPSPGGFIDRYLDFSEYTNSRSVADPVLRLICGRPPGSDPVPGGEPQVPAPPTNPGFSGGQCICDSYSVTVFVSSASSGSGIDRSIGPIPGPIQGFSVYYQESSPGVVSAGGPEVTYGDPTCGGVRTDRLPGVPAFDRDVQLSNIRITNLTNPSDDCGNPPSDPSTDPSVPTPQPLPPVTYDPGDGGGPITIAPEIGIDIGQGGPALRIGLGDVNFFVDVGGVDINFPAAPTECCPPGALQPQPEDVAPDPNSPVEPPPPDVPPNNDPDEETNRVFRAVIVTLRNLNSPATPLRPGNGSPTVFAPRAGTLQFKISTGDGATGWTHDIDLKNAQQYVEVPAVQGAIDARVFPYGTADVTITRIYQTIDSSIPQVTT